MNALLISITYPLGSSLILTMIYLYLYRQEREDFMGIWTLSWLFHSLRYLFIILYFIYPDILYFLALNQICVLTSGFLLVGGFARFLDRRMSRWWSLPGVLLYGWLLYTTFSGKGPFLMSLPIFLFLGGVYLWTGLAFIYTHKERNLGIYLTGISLILWGGNKLNYPFRWIEEWALPWGYLVGAILGILVGFGIIITYYEQTRSDLQRNEKALDKALLESLRRETEVTLLLNGARMILGSRDFPSTARSILSGLHRYTGAEAILLVLRPVGGDVIEVIDGGGEGSNRFREKIEQDRALADALFACGNTLSGDRDGLPDTPVVSLAASLGAGNLLVSPLLLKEEMSGLFLLINKPEPFDEDDAEIAEAFAGLAVISLMSSLSRDRLQQSEERFRSLVESVNDVVFTLDDHSRHTGLYGQWVKESGDLVQSFLGKTAEEIFGREAGAIHMENNRKALAGERLTYEWVLGEGQDVRYYQTSLSPLRLDDQRVVGIVGLGRDITELKRAQQDLTASLREKELMLKEIHHRVKNNMQIISSLINLQSRYVPDDTYRKLFLESAHRIRAMSLVHEKLYQSKNFARINFHDYISALAGYLFDSYNVDRRYIDLSLEVSELEIGIDQAIPCAQIINELMSNSLKYAFAPGREGRIFLMFSRNGDGSFHLVVGDDGRGLPEEFGLDRTATLGYQLITGLVRQLRGTLSLIRDKGTVVSLVFPENIEKTG